MRSRYLLLWAVANLMLVVAVRAGDKEGAALQTSNLRFTVLKDDNNKPVRNASVVLHPVRKDGGQSRGGFQIKTDNEGKASSDGLPYGTLRVQVLAPGFQTFGDDYQIDKPEMEIEIRLRRPKGQYSIYDSLENKQQSAPTAPPTEPKPH